MSVVNWSEFLRPGERLLWTGHPSRKLVHPAWGDLTSLIMLAVPGYLIFDLAGSPNRGLGEYLFLSLFIILFGGVSIGWIPYNRNLRRHTFYALTDRRVVIRTGIRNPRNHVHELEAWDLPETFFDSADSGTIVFDARRRPTASTGLRPGSIEVPGSWTLAHRPQAATWRWYRSRHAHSGNGN